MHSRTLGCHTTTFTTTTAKTAAVVMVLGMVMVGNGGVAAASPSRSRQQELRRLWERVTSHTETLRNINYYLKQTDIFWTWFQENKGRLDEILSEDRSSPSPDNDRVMQRLDDLERKQKTRDEELQETRTALQEEREKTTRLEARLQRYREENQNILRREIPKVEDRMTQLETQLAALNQTTLGNKRDIDGLQQNTDNLMEVVDETQSASSEEMNALRELLQDIMMNTVFPLEDQMMQLNQSQLALSEEASQGFIDVRGQIRSLSAKLSSKQGSNRGRGLQPQITALQTTMGRVQGQIAELDGIIANASSQQDQFQKLHDEQSRIQTRLSRLERASGNMNLEIKTTIEDVNKLKRDVAHLKQYNNLTDHVRTLRIPTTAAANMQPIGPPGSVSSGRPSYPGRRDPEGGLRRPGNQGWRGEPGDPGSRGAPGTPGAPGSPGSRGEQGSPGAPGGRGAPGSPGLRGEQGSPGAPGSRGAPGSPGSRGSSGSRGVPGGSGSSGVRGSPGVPGNAGLRGPPGSPGMRGTTGAQGLRGAPGSPGAPGMPGYPGSPGYTGYPGSRWYANTSPAYAGYSASPGYAGYPGAAGYGGYYQG